MDSERFKTEVFPCKNKLYRLALRLLGGHEDARDAVQETFLKMWKIREKLDACRSVEAFAVTMTKNYCLDKLRARRTVSLEEIHLQHEISANTDGQEQRIEAEETYRKVKDLMMELPELQRLIVQLRDVEGYDFQQISEIADMNVNAVRVNLSRGRQRLRDLYTKREGYGNQKITGKILRR
jgi:RNA polymerase sigma factor (sigma-70 family)